MSVNTSDSPGGANGGSSGTTGTQSQPGSQGDPAASSESTQQVSYETHRKLLAEKKKVQEERDALAARLKTQEEDDLKRKGDIEKLLKLREDELQKARADHKQLEENIQGGLKLDAVLNTVNGKVDKRYWRLIDLSDVVIDPNTGVPDPTSVSVAVKKFESSYPEVVVKATGARLPNEAASSGAGLPMTEETWKRLSPKDRKLRYSEYAAMKAKERGWNLGARG